MEPQRVERAEAAADQTPELRMTMADLNLERGIYKQETSEGGMSVLLLTGLAIPVVAFGMWALGLF